MRKNPLVLSLFVTGLGGITAQTVLLRELLVAFFGNELSIAIILANWLALEALGGFFLGRAITRTRAKTELFILTQIIFAFSLPAMLYLARAARAFTLSGAGGLPFIFTASLAVFFLPAVCHGALFTFGCKLYAREKGRRGAFSIGRVYIYEILGTICGGFIFTYILLPVLSSFQIVLLVALSTSVFTLPLLKLCRSRKIAALFVTLSVLLLGGLIFKWRTLEDLSIRSQWPRQEVIYYKNSFYGNLAITKNNAQYSLFLNGLPAVTLPRPDVKSIEDFIHLALLYQGRPRRVLMLGGGGEMIPEVLKYPVKRVDYVEKDPMVFDAFNALKVPSLTQALNDGRVAVHLSDARRFTAGAGESYDAVFLGLRGGPGDLRGNRFFSREFFVLVARKLRNDGVFVLSLPGSLTYLGPQIRDLNACIFRTLSEVYPYLRVIPREGDVLYLAAKRDIFDVPVSKLTQRAALNGVALKTINSAYLEYILNPQHAQWFLKELKESKAGINGDFYPRAVGYGVRYWDAMFSPFLEKLLVSGFWPRVILVIFSVILIFILGRRRMKAALAVCVASSGFCAMFFSLVLIFAFQSTYGYVYHWIGLLTAIFMAGAAAAAARILPRLDSPRRRVLFLGGEAGFFVFPLVLVLFIFCLRFFKTGGVSDIFVKTLFLSFSFAAGGLLGAQFALANKLYLSSKKEDITHSAGALYACDLIGGFFAGLAAVFVFSSLGFINVCFLLMFLKSISGIGFYVSKPG